MVPKRATAPRGLTRSRGNRRVQGVVLERRASSRGRASGFLLERTQFLNGEIHREDGPAAEYANGDKWWFLNGENHREDGPAIEYASESNTGSLTESLTVRMGRRRSPRLEKSCGI
jgi:hypothetical protein